MALVIHLNNVASGLHHRSAIILQQEFSLSQSPALTALVFDTSLEKGTLDIRRAITPLDVNWAEALAQRWRAAVALWREGDIALACTNMGACVQAMVRGFSVWEVWMLPVMYTVLRDLRFLAIQADKELRKRKEKEVHLEEAARLINRAFTSCMTDRAPLETSRKWGTYFFASMLVKTYFRLNKPALCANVQRAVNVTELPPISEFPRSHIVTWKYYCGAYAFGKEDYEIAQRELNEAYNMSLSASTHNIGLILSYLLPLHLISSTYPSRTLLRKHQRLYNLYQPLFTAIRTGNLHLFDTHFTTYSSIFLRQRVYLAIERSRQCCMRALFERAAMLYTGTRIPIDVFQTALRVGGDPLDREETECFVANMIYRGWMKGYISRERGMVVLSAKEGFPKISRSVTWMKQ